MGKSQDFGVCFTVPDYSYTQYDFDFIQTSVKSIFESGYTALDSVYSGDTWSIIYIIQPPVLTSSSSWKVFFSKMKKLLEVTRDYQSHFCNEPGALVND